jgi:hypothetical protein
MKTLLALITLLTSMSSFAYYHCTVDLGNVDYYTGRMSYVYTSFHSTTDYQGNCRDGMRDCNRYRRTNNLMQYQCKARPDYRPGTGPYPGPGPGPGPRPGNRFSYLLTDSDWSLAGKARDGLVGTCRVDYRPFGYACDYYVKVNGLSYPNTSGTGCADRQYTRRYGCDSYSERENAGCLIRKAIRQGACR